MAFCINCGHPQEPNSKFCNQCGHKMLEVKEEDSYSGDYTRRNNTESYGYNSNESQGSYNNSFSNTGYSDGYSNSYSSGYSYESSPLYVTNQEVSKSSSIVSMVFGILAVSFSIFCYIPVVFFFFTAACIVFMCVSNSRRNAHLSYGLGDNGFSKAGKICTIVAIPLTAVFSFIGLIATFALM